MRCSQLLKSARAVLTVELQSQMSETRAQKLNRWMMEDLNLTDGMNRYRRRHTVHRTEMLQFYVYNTM